VCTLCHSAEGYTQLSDQLRTDLQLEGPMMQSVVFSAKDFENDRLLSKFSFAYLQKNLNIFNQTFDLRDYSKQLVIQIHSYRNNGANWCINHGRPTTAA
jgi:hypothetical protein